MTAVRRKSEFGDDRETKKPKKKVCSRVAKVCVKLIDELIGYPAGWIFSHPVDPVKSKIPDYFSIIKKPMDLGTVRRNLERGLYSNVEEFAADVRLVFSNAMKYNPPSNVVHVLAKKLNAKFYMGWKLIKARLKSGDLDGGKKKDSLSKGIAATGIKKGQSVNCRETKLKARAALEQLLSEQVFGDVQTLFRKLGLSCFTKEKLHSYLRSCDDESLQNLRREFGAFLNAKLEKVKAVSIALKGYHNQSDWGLDKQEQTFDPTPVKSARKAQKGFLTMALKKTVQRENCNQHPCKSGNQGQSVDDISDFEVRPRPPLVGRHSRSSCSEFDMPKVVQNPDDCPCVSTPPTDASSSKGCNLSSTEMSPRHALRAAMLKKRFADTIFKAMHQEPLIKKDQNSDFYSRREETERLLKEQQQEKAKIEAEFRAAEAAASRRSRDNSKTKFESERAAMRMALEKMEGTAVIDGNAGLLDDLINLGDGSLTYLYYGAKGPLTSSLLERVGLHLKDGYSTTAAEEEDYDFEDGEILF